MSPFRGRENVVSFSGWTYVSLIELDQKYKNLKHKNSGQEFCQIKSSLLTPDFDG